MNGMNAATCREAMNGKHESGVRRGDRGAFIAFILFIPFILSLTETRG